MSTLLIGIIIILVALVAIKAVPKEYSKFSGFGYVFVFVGFLVSLSGLFAYNDAGNCQHIRTITGSESSTCKTGWYVEGFGSSTKWPHFVTIAHTPDADAAGSSISTPYPVRLADNWNGTVTQTTRFGIPQDEEQFIKMARDFRSPERLITTTLRPAVTASLDSVSNLFTMEEYYAGGQRDEFKTEFRDAVMKGRAKVEQTSFNKNGVVINQRAAPNDLDQAQDTSNVGDTNVRRVQMTKILDSSGNELREEHGYVSYGITVSSAILEGLDPDDRFEDQIQARKDAASRRIVAQEERKEQEEQRLLAIQRGQTDIAKRQAAAQVEQIQRTTEAETEKKLALIGAARRNEEAEIAKNTAAINLERAEIDAESVKVTADAEAYAKQAILEADGALAQKLDAYVRTQQVWAEAASKINVPSTVMGGDASTGSAIGTINDFMAIMTMQAAKSINFDPSVGETK